MQESKRLKKKLDRSHLILKIQTQSKTKAIQL